MGFEDVEAAAEAGRRSGETRRRKRELTPEQRVQDAIASKLPQLTKELLDAALGLGDFEDLKLETRVATATRLVEWRIGRPAAVKPKEDDVEAEQAVAQDGDDLFE